jgi:hypothetical protein
MIRPGQSDMLSGSSHILIQLIIGETMPQSREDRIYLAYTAAKAAFIREGITDRVHGRTLLYIAELFNVNPLRVQKIVRTKQPKQ